MTGEYEEWQSLLSDAFLLPHDGPTVLFLDDSEITCLLPEAEDAGRHLAEAVRTRVRPSEGRPINPYDDAVEDARDIAAAIEEFIEGGLIVRLKR